MTPDQVRPMPPPTDAERRRELARMRALATGLLVFMALLFGAARLARGRWPWIPALEAFSEAAMVGALADWFAVTALFRRPLGLPIPHTAIIPRNKDRIGQALGGFIAGNFLTPGVLDQRLKDLAPGRRLADWLVRGETVDALAGRLAAFLPDLVGTGEEARGLIGDWVRRAAGARPLAPTAGHILAWLWGEPRAQQALNGLIASLVAYLKEHEDFIQARLADGSWRWLPKWLDRLLAGKFTGGLLGAVEGLASSDHPWREDINRAMIDLIDRLKHDPDLLIQGEAFKARLLSEPGFSAAVERAWSVLATRVGGDPDARKAALEDVFARVFRALGRWLTEDRPGREALDRGIRVVVRRALSSQRQAIGGFVAQVVSGWDAGEVTDRLELQVGRDLQYIRINGTLVGGLAGLAIFFVAQWMP